MIPFAKPTRSRGGGFICPDVWSYDFDDDCYRALRVNRNALDPLSLQAVSIRHLPLHNMLRLSDAWHQPLPPDMRRTEEQPEEGDEDFIPDPVRAPQFVRDLLALAEQHRVFNHLDGAGILRVRTWYLHHHDDRRCLHPRILEYDADWRHWEIELGSAWRTHIRPNEEIQIHVANARPVPWLHVEASPGRSHHFARTLAPPLLHHHHSAQDQSLTCTTFLCLSLLFGAACQWSKTCG